MTRQRISLTVTVSGGTSLGINIGPDGTTDNKVGISMVNQSGVRCLSAVVARGSL